MRTLDEMMARMDFAPTDTGPYVTELRKVIARQMANGMTDRSPGTWASDKFTAEERARAFLELDWAIENDHYCEVKNIDGDWSRPDTMIGDWVRQRGLDARILRDKVLGRKNPYARAS